MVARAGKTMWPRLLAAQRVPARGQGLEHVAVAHRGLDHVDAPLAHGQAEPQVGHHGDDHGVARQHAPLVAVEGEDGDQVVAVDQLAPVIDHQHPVGVAVEGDAQVGAPLDHVGLQVAGVGGPAAVVDVDAVGRPVDHVDLDAQAAQDVGRHRGGRAVGAVDHRPQAGEAPALQRGHDGPAVAAVHALGHDQRTDRRADGVGVRRAAPAAEQGAELGLELLLDGVGQLASAGREQLDAVVGEGVVGGGDRPPPVPLRSPTTRPPRAWGPRRGSRRRRPRRPGPRPARPRAAARTGACRARWRTARRPAPGPRRGRARAPARG